MLKEQTIGEKINKLWKTNFTKEDLIELYDEIYNLGWNQAIKSKNATISILMKENKDTKIKITDYLKKLCWKDKEIEMLIKKL